MFNKYQHVERFGNDAVDGIENGKCYVFPKIDGTNASVWLEDGEVKAGSRNRELSLGKDNAGFYAWVLQQKNIKEFLLSNPTARLFGEWLVPHSLKTYREDAWRDFYVFDVMVTSDDGSISYVPYELYNCLLEDHGIKYIPPMRVIENGSFEDFIKMLPINTFLIEDGKGHGEGIVIKNYNYVNKYGRPNWAKIVSNEFKEKHIKVMGASETKPKEMIEDQIIEKFYDEAIGRKLLASIKRVRHGWNSRYIPELLNRIYYDFITEELWDVLKVMKNPKIDFRTLQFKLNKKIRESLPEVF